ncbi:MAG TPA: cyclic nucleotide-binding domain-containing protein [Candidatus Dormibacteraeota bacterium]|nr:cyclic nucleotide-binding domain-containing protein [Candidatus Dormibacteraeota bacterium]
MDGKHLTAIPLLEGLSTRQLAQLARTMDEVQVREGSSLTAQGRLGHEFLLIEAGTAAVTIDGEHVRDLGPGDILGEIALLRGPERTASVVATSPVSLIAMTGQAFRAMIEDFPVIGERIREIAAERLRR